MNKKFVVNSVGKNGGHYYRVINVRSNGKLDLIAVGRLNSISNFCENRGLRYNDIYPDLLDFICQLEPEYD